jgi:hypothetical protein
MRRTWVFTLEKVQYPDNGFNKEMTSEPPLSVITTEGQT